MTLTAKTPSRATVLSIAFSVEWMSDECVVVIAVHPEAGEIGWMDLGAEQPVGRVINEITVVPDFRRQGVATALWNFAESEGLRPAHSSYRTEAGDAWAATVSDYLPKNLYCEE